MARFFFVLSLCLISQAYLGMAEFTGRAMERAKEIDKECREETGAAADSFLHYIRADKFDDPTYKCYMKCFMVKMKSLSEDGIYNIDEEMLNVPPEIKEEGHRIINICQHTTPGTDPCDTAYKIHQCYHDSNPELYNRVISFWEKQAKQ